MSYLQYLKTDLNLNAIRKLFFNIIMNNNEIYYRYYNLLLLIFSKTRYIEYYSGF